MIIEEADNGWVITYPNHNLSGDAIEVVEFPTNVEDGDKEYEEAVQKLLYVVKEGLGIFGSKHNKYRTFIEVEKQ